MSQLQNLRDILNKHINEIDQHLTNKLKTLFSDQVEEIEKKDVKVKNLRAKKDKAEKQAIALSEELSKLRQEYKRAEEKLISRQAKYHVAVTEIDDEITDLTRIERAEIKTDIPPAVVLGDRYGDIKKAEVQAWMTVKKSNEALNYKAFQKVSTDLENLLMLTVTPKEQRGLIMSFLSKDWRSLEIDLPPILNVNDFDISNGMITTNLLPQGQE